MILNRRPRLTAVVATLLLSGVFAPIVIGQVSGGSQSTLAALVEAGESSRSYAGGVVNLALAHGLQVSSAQALVTQGDALLATATADSQSGSNTAAGIQAAQAAMSDYTKAAALASIALTNSGLTSAVDYDAAVSALAEVNATATIAASAADQLCVSSGEAVSNASSFTQACGQADAQTSAARTHLSEAAALLAQSQVNSNLSQALSLVALARSEVQSAQSAILTASSYAYGQRARAFITSVVSPLSAKANATISAEQSSMSIFNQAEASFASYSEVQSSATANITSSAASLASLIGGVETNSVSSSIQNAQSVSAEVNSQDSTLLGISGIQLLPAVVADINALQSSAASYSSALSGALTQSDAYPQTQLVAFPSYMGALAVDSSAAQSSGASYVSAYQTLLAALNVPGVLAIPGVQAIYNSLVGLQVSGSVDGVNASLQQELSSMENVEAGIVSTTNVVASSSASILVNTDLTASISWVSSQSRAFLNVSGTQAVTAAAASLMTTVESAQSFVASANATVTTTIGGFASSATSLSDAGSSLHSQTQATTSALAMASAFVSSDLRIRTTVAAAGQADVAQALGFFSVQDLSAGVAAMDNAVVDLQAAAQPGA